MLCCFIYMYVYLANSSYFICSFYIKKIFQIVFCNDDSPTIRKFDCSCPIDLSEACGHIYNWIVVSISKYKVLNLKALPEDVAKTFQAQTWHTLRGEKIKSKEVQDLEVKSQKSIVCLKSGIQIYHCIITGKSVDSELFQFQLLRQVFTFVTFLFQFFFQILDYCIFVIQ